MHNVAFATCVQLGLSCIEEIYRIGGKLDLLITLKDEKDRNKSGRIYLNEIANTEEQLKLRIEERNKNRSRFRRTSIIPQKIKGNLSGINKKVYTLEQQLYFKARNEKYKDVKDLAETILLLRNEKIDKRSDIDLRIKELNTMASKINKDIKELEDKSRSFNEVAKYLSTYNKYKDLYKKYEDTVFNKKTSIEKMKEKYFPLNTQNLS